MGHQNMALLYDRDLRPRQIPVNKSEKTWNWSFNTPCKSLKDILVLFKAEQSFTQDMNKFYNPHIQKVIVKGKSNQLYIQGMQWFEQYNEICKHFTERLQKDNNVTEVLKHLQFHDLSVGECLTDKYVL